MDNEWSEEYSLNNFFDTLKYDVDETTECLAVVTGILKATGNFDDITPKYAISLEDEQGRECILIVCPTDAAAVNDQINQDQPERPFSYDLILNIVNEMGGKIINVVIDDVWKQTYYAKIRIRMPNERVIAIDSRPCDAIVMAMKSGTSIYICERVMKYTQQLDIE